MAYFTKEYKENAFDFINDRIYRIKDMENIAYSGDGEDYTDEFITDRIDEAAYEMGASWGKFGASKCVFKFNEYPDVVFKIPFKGSISAYWDEDEEEYFIDDGDVYDFMYAGEKNEREWDYCETEARNYILAEECGVEDIFAPTEFLGLAKHEVPVYISENIENYIGTKLNPSVDSIKTAESIRETNNYYHVSDVRLASYIDSHSEEEANKLIQFLKDNEIYDLHAGNWRMDSEGNVRIIDYSSWND